jgi:hypothetical protein
MHPGFRKEITMRLLMTGFTKQACNDTKRKRVERIEPNTEMAGLLRNYGWDVTQRPVVPGEDLSDFDAVWVSIGSPPGSTGAKHAPGGLWTLNYASERGIPTVIYVEDWDGNKLRNGFRYFAKTGVRQLAKMMGCEPLYLNTDAAIRHGDEIIAMAHQVIDAGSPLWQRAVLATWQFQGLGDSDLLRRSFVGVPFMGIDPSPLIMPIAKGVVPNGIRERQWILAALTSHSNEWADGQRLNWPVERYGWAKTRQPVLKTEREVAETYARNWGVLCPEYYHAGSGWYRPRMVVAAAVGAVVLCGPTDAAMYGEAYQVNARQVERLSDAELRDLAAAQRETLWPRLAGDERETLHHVEMLIQAARTQVS